MSVAKILSPAEVDEVARKSAARIAGEINRLNEKFSTEYPGAIMSVRDEDPSADTSNWVAAIRNLGDNIAKLIAYEVVVVPIVPDAKPWDQKEALGHAIARFGLLIKDLDDRFPALLEENRKEAWKFLSSRSEDILMLLRSFGIIASVGYACSVLANMIAELQGLDRWIDEAPRVDVEKRLLATQESIRAWSHQELKHLDSIAHAGQVVCC